MVDKERMMNKGRFRKYNSSSDAQSRPNSDGYMFGGGFKKDGYEVSHMNTVNHHMYMYIYIYIFDIQLHIYSVYSCITLIQL